jgi:hypothetical protein
MFGGAFVGLLSKGKAESVFTILARCCRFDAQQASHFVVAGFALFIERNWHCSDVRFWHKADLETALTNVRFRE